MKRFRILLVALAAIACGDSDPSTEPATCRAFVQFGPRTATLRVGETVAVAFTAEAGCPGLRVRSETTGIVGMLQVSTTGMTVVGIAPGEGRIRLRSGVDTTVTDVAVFSVLPR